MLIVLNHKCNLTTNEFKDYYHNLQQINQYNHQIVICPSFLNIAYANSKSILNGSQNVSKYDIGAYTGEVSAKQLNQANISFCLVGHSERRTLFHERNIDTNLKINQLLKNGITPILCVGETKEERDQNKYKEVILKQIEEAFSGITVLNRVIIAYEPIWSIGTGIIPKIDEVEEVIAWMKEVYPNQTILYGGSANENNIEEIKKCSFIDGFLLGGLSLHVDKLQLFLDKLIK